MPTFRCASILRFDFIPSYVALTAIAAAALSAKKWAEVLTVDFRPYRKEVWLTPDLGILW